MEMALRTSNLSLPQGFVEMDREEMMYVNGGATVKSYWWGTRISFSHSETQTIGYAITVGNGVASIVSAFLPPPVGQVLGVAMAIQGVSFATAIFVADHGNGIRLDFSWPQYALLLSMPYATTLSLLASIRSA